MADRDIARHEGVPTALVAERRVVLDQLASDPRAQAMVDERASRDAPPGFVTDLDLLLFGVANTADPAAARWPTTIDETAAAHREIRQRMAEADLDVMRAILGVIMSRRWPTPVASAIDRARRDVLEQDDGTPPSGEKGQR